MSEFELVIEGPRGKIDVSTLTTMLQEGQKLLRSVPDGNISCTIGNLSVGSAHVSIIAPEPTIDIVLDGLDFLESHNEIPPGWTRKSLEALHGMENCYGRPGVERIRLGANQRFTALEKKLLDNAKNAMPADRLSLGAVEGRIYSCSNREGEPTAKLEISGKKQVVRLVFDNEFIPDILACIKEEATVIVRSLLTRNPEDKQVSEVRVRGLQRAVGKKPALSCSFKGILSDMWPEDCDPAEEVRRQRC